MIRPNPQTFRWLLLCALIIVLGMAVASRPVAAQSFGNYQDLHDFGGTINVNGTNTTDGLEPSAGVTLDSSGNKYGTTRLGGTHNLGNIWEITTNGTYLDLHDFGGTVTNADGNSGPDGEAPNGGVTFDSSGNMYGTADGGKLKLGMIWEITANGAYRDLHDFGGTVTNADGTSGPDGQTPDCGVTLDSAGNLYGTTFRAGPNWGLLGSYDFGGTVWEVTASGVYKDLHDFGSTVTVANGTSGPDGFDPIGNVAFDSHGNMFGTASDGGPNILYTIMATNFIAAAGVVWEITAGGVYKDIHDFGGTVANADGSQGPDGNIPSAGVVFDSAGNMYGTTFGGGPNNFNSTQGAYGDGTVWEITAGGTYKDLHDFGGAVSTANGTSGSDGAIPRAPVTLDGSGDLLGTASSGGRVDEGMIWRITNGGIYQDLHDFGPNITNANGSTGSDGMLPIAEVTLDTNGDMLGTTFQGGANEQGMVWEIAPIAAFSAGLQMISLPYTYTGVSLDTIFGYSDVTLAAWMPAISAYAVTPTPPANQISLGQGDWARFPQDVFVYQTGTPARTDQNFDIRLSTGWNMIGQPFVVSTPVSSLLFNNGTETFAQATGGANPLIGATIWTYPAGATAYSPATSLDPNQGYWILALSDTDVQVPHP